jgi:hypothetical protein
VSRSTIATTKYHFDTFCCGTGYCAFGVWITKHIDLVSIDRRTTDGVQLHHHVHMSDANQHNGFNKPWQKKQTMLTCRYASSQTLYTHNFFITSIHKKKSCTMLKQFDAKRDATIGSLGSGIGGATRCALVERQLLAASIGHQTRVEHVGARRQRLH